jgi:hypothetical protein
MRGNPLAKQVALALTSLFSPVLTSFLSVFKVAQNSLNIRLAQINQGEKTLIRQSPLSHKLDEA